jgi:hypothetical protein
MTCKMQIVRNGNRLITANRHCGKRQTRPLVRESASYQQIYKCLTEIKIWS